MLIQRAGTGTLAPPGFTSPPWGILSEFWNHAPVPITKSVIIGPTTLELGHDDRECDDFLPGQEFDTVNHIFGWDNENPLRELEVGPFKIDWRPITNGEFSRFLQSAEGDIIKPPKSWVEDEGEWKVIA
jgi:L-histidine Nalpha-methyltransferase / hercynylcysteine S-oxide synthase